MKINDKLTRALVICIAQCEEIGNWSDNGEDMVSPIDGGNFKDCADVCNLALRLYLRTSITSRQCLILSNVLIESCIDTCISIREDKFHADLDFELLGAIKKFNQLLNEIKNI